MVHRFNGYGSRVCVLNPMTYMYSKILLAAMFENPLNQRYSLL